MASVVNEAIELEAREHTDARRLYGQILQRADNPEKDDARSLVALRPVLRFDWPEVAKDLAALADLKRLEQDARTAEGNAKAAKAAAREAGRLRHQAEERAREFAGTPKHADRPAAQKAYSEAIAAHEAAQRKADESDGRLQELYSAATVRRASLIGIFNP